MMKLLDCLFYAMSGIDFDLQFFCIIVMPAFQDKIVAELSSNIAEGNAMIGR